MKRQFYITSAKVVIILIVLGLVGSCVSQPKELPAAYSVNIHKLDEREILAIRSKRDANPFIEPGSLLKGKVNEFIVFQIDISIDQTRTIKIDSIMQDREKNYIEAYYPEQLIAYWDQFVTRTEKASLTSYAKKVSLIKKIVLPTDTLTLYSGEYTYYLVFIGPYPIKKPAQAQIDVSTSSGEYNSFKFTIQ